MKIPSFLLKTVPDDAGVVLMSLFSILCWILGKRGIISIKSGMLVDPIGTWVVTILFWIVGVMILLIAFRAERLRYRQNLKLYGRAPITGRN